MLWITLSLGRTTMGYKVKLYFLLTCTSHAHQQETEIDVVINNMDLECAVTIHP